MHEDETGARNTPSHGEDADRRPSARTGTNVQLRIESPPNRVSTCPLSWGLAARGDRKLSQIIVAGASGGAQSVGPEGLRSIFEHSIDGILFSAPDGRILSANPAAATILRMSSADICDRGRAGLADPTDDRWIRGIRERAETGSFFGDLRMIRGDGSTLTAEVSSSVFHNEAGEERACVIFRDASERERLNQERHELLAREEVLRDRERVGREFQATVIPRLFSLVLTIEAILEITKPEAVRKRLASAVIELDDVLRQLRETVFGELP